MGAAGGTTFVDAGVVDSGVRDASAADGGVRDASSADSGIRSDAGTADAGSTTTVATWSGTALSGYTKFHNTASLAAGTYVVTMTGTGDADLYVKIGGTPTTTSYTCRPYLTGINESCTVSLASSNAIYVIVKGVSVTSSYTVNVVRR